MVARVRRPAASIVNVTVPAQGFVPSGEAEDVRGRNEADVAGMRATGGADATFGILSAEISRYPVAVPVKVDAIPPEGSPFTIASFSHMGGSVSLPYSVPRGTTLALSVLNQEKERFAVQ